MSYAWLPTHYLGPAPAVPGNLPRLPNAMTPNTYAASSASSIQHATTTPGSQHSQAPNTTTRRQAPKSILRSPDSSYYSSTSSSSSGNNSHGVAGHQRGLPSPRRVSFTRDTKLGSSGHSSSLSSSRYGNRNLKNYSHYNALSSHGTMSNNNRHDSKFFSSSKGPQQHRSSHGRSNVSAPYEKTLQHHSSSSSLRSGTALQRSMSTQRCTSGREARGSSRTH